MLFVFPEETDALVLDEEHADLARHALHRAPTAASWASTPTRCRSRPARCRSGSRRCTSSRSMAAGPPATTSAPATGWSSTPSPAHRDGGLARGPAAGGGRTAPEAGHAGGSPARGTGRASRAGGRAARLAALEADGRLVRLPGDRWVAARQAGLRRRASHRQSGRLRLLPARRSRARRRPRRPPGPSEPPCTATACRYASDPAGRAGRVAAASCASSRAASSACWRLPAGARRARVLVPQDPRITAPIVRRGRRRRRRARRRPGGRARRAPAPSAIARRSRASSASSDRPTIRACRPMPSSTRTACRSSSRPRSRRRRAGCRRRSPPRDLRDRADLRTLPLVTIDGENARDFDDAVAGRAAAARASASRSPSPTSRTTCAEDDAIDREARGARHERLLPRPRDPDAARGAVERHLQPEARTRTGWCRRCGSTSTPPGALRGADVPRRASCGAPRASPTPRCARRVVDGDAARAPRSAACSSRSSTRSASPPRCSRAAARAARSTSTCPRPRSSSTSAAGPSRSSAPSATSRTA